MTPAERERAVNYLTQSRDDLLRAVRGLSREQLQFKPAPDRWCVADCLEHLILVENRRIGEGIPAALQQPIDPARRSAYEGRDDELVRLVAGRVQRVQAPEPVRPAGRWPHDRLIPEFEAARKRSTDLVTTTQANLRQYLSTHPLFGDLDCYQWLLLIAAHSDRHRTQIEELVASPGFPRAAAV
ncbi:MAG TPA: DinB family protein [Candidatus Acidoferrum sp.]|nr:DinB family protein [Candidatus Acidoferrum sp.]